jgi:hypothetical protein
VQEIKQAFRDNLCCGIGLLASNATKHDLGRYNDGGSGVISTAADDDFLHDFPACSLQWSQAAPRQEPDAFLLLVAIDNIDAVGRQRVMECCAGVLGYEFEKSFSPRVFSITKDFFSNPL